MSMRNFKGIRNLEVSFQEETNIRGDNATGKATVFDAFLWLLFGKDSSGRKDFNIKTLDQNGNPINRLSHEVEGVIYVDGAKWTLKRVYKEKWTKPRGQAEEVFSGHETVFFIDEIPLSQKDYQERIEGICNEGLFKLITNPLHFPNLPWQEQRNILFSIVGDIEDSDVLNAMPDNKGKKELIAILESGKTLADTKKTLAAQKKKIKDELEKIPARIDEANRSKPEAEDWTLIESEINAKDKQIAEIDHLLNDVAQADKDKGEKIAAIQGKIRSLNFNIQSLEDIISANEKAEYKEQVDELEAVKKGLEQARSDLKDEQGKLKLAREQLKEYEADIADLRKEWSRLNAESLEVDYDQFVCPACKRELEASDIEAKRQELVTNFNSDKAKRLASNVKRGKAVSAEIEKYKGKIQDVETLIEDLSQHIAEQEAWVETLINSLPATEPDVKSIIAADPEILELKEQVKKHESDLAGHEAETPSREKVQHNETKANLKTEVDGLKKRLANRDYIERAEKRIEELRKQLAEQSQELANLEQVEFAIQEFTRTKIDKIEQSVNSLFQIVRFKMFDRQINGGEAETCVCTVDGVPYSDLNNAMKVNAGLDIINTLSSINNVSAPIFIDNRESVTKLITLESQLVNLIVTPDLQLLVN